MQQCEEFGHYAFYLVGYEHLVAVELNLVSLQLDVRLDAREVENASEIERIVDVEVDPEERLVLHRIECAVEALVVLVLESAGRLGPERLYVVDDVVLVGFNLLAILPLSLLAESYRNRHKLAVLVEQLLNLLLLEKLLAVVVDVEHDIRTAVGLVGVAYFKLGASVAAPLDGLGSVLIAACNDVYTLAHHER